MIWKNKKKEKKKRKKNGSYCVIVSIYTFFVLQPYAFLAHNSESNTGVKRAAKQVWNTLAFLDQKSWNL